MHLVLTFCLDEVHFSTLICFLFLETPTAVMNDALNDSGL